MAEVGLILGGLLEEFIDKVVLDNKNTGEISITSQQQKKVEKDNLLNANYVFPMNVQFPYVNKFGNTIIKEIDKLPNKIMISFKDVQKIHKDAIEKLIQITNIVKEKSKKLFLCNVNPTIYKVIKIAGYESQLNFYHKELEPIHCS